jgi:transposase
VARLYWDLLSRLDLSKFYEWIKACGRSPGRPATDPKILLTLWLLALNDGVTSANEIVRLCEFHDAYRWVCGGVSVCDHLLTDFRKDNGEAIDALFTQVLTVLIKQGVLTVDRVAHDGMRVRANAGAASFRREVTLLECAEEAEAYLEHMRREAAKPGNQWSKKKAAAKERGARDRLERVEQALKDMPKVKEAKLKTAKRQGPAAYQKALALQSKGNRAPDLPVTPDEPLVPTEPPPSPVSVSSSSTAKTGEAKAKPPVVTEREERAGAPRVSTTDSDARVMKMADGGFRPAVNYHFATETRTRVVVGVGVTNVGSDGGEMPAMLSEVRARTGMTPPEYLVDGGFVKLDDIEAAEAGGTKVFAPVPEPNSPGVDPYKPKSTDGPGIAAWRQRMATPEAKTIFKERASTAETIHGDFRVNRGLDRLLVRGLPNALMVGLLTALSYNLVQPAVVTAIRALKPLIG